MKIEKGMPLPLGISQKKTGFNFSIAVAPKYKCELLLYKNGNQETEIPLLYSPGYGNIRCVQVLELEEETYTYLYRVDGKLLLDPYVRGIENQHEWGKPYEKDGIAKGKVKLPEFEWEDDVPLHIPYHEIIGYSLHVRGFTKHSSSKVKAKGTFAGIMEKIPYLQELGINQIQCMPVYEFEECGHYNNYWGYGDALWFTPKTAYSHGKDSTLELKQLVKSCHQAGIEVVLDFPFSNECSFQLIIECLTYYALEYHVDGFIVNPSVVSMEELNKNPLLSSLKIMKKQDTFQNVMRRFLKGDEGMVSEAIWWLRHTSKQEGIFNYITQHTGFTLNDLVSYDGKHNELNGENNQDGPDYNYSWNCGIEGPTRRKVVTELRERQVRNAFFLLLLAQGTPVILAGDEFSNSQKGNNNVYCQDNAIGWLNWGGLEKNPELFAYVKNLIALRKKYSVFHPEKELLGIDQSSCGVPDVSYHGESAWAIPNAVASRQLGVYYAAEESIFVAYNMHWEKHEFALPTIGKDGVWKKIISTDKKQINNTNMETYKKMLTIEARTIVMLIGQQENLSKDSKNSLKEDKVE